MYYYQNMPSRKKNTSFLKKLIVQLIAIFTIMLFLILTKYVPGTYAKKITNSISNVFYDDMTNNVMQVFNKYSPDVKNYFDNLFNNKSKIDNSTSVILNFNHENKLYLKNKI